MKPRLIFNSIVVCSLLLIGASLAHAQATRTWVSGMGDDANPCSRIAPCKTFAGAISKTAINGEIDIVDSGAYGAVTIVKSITIDGTGHFAGIVSGATNGITINLNDASGNDVLKIVRLRGLSINGTGSGTRIGVRGIYIPSLNPDQPKVVIEHVVVDGFTNEGLLFNSNGGDLTIWNSTFRNNGTAGVRVDSNGANTIFATVNNTHANLNQEGFRMEDNVRAAFRDDTASSNSANGFVVITSTIASEMNVDSSTSSNNRFWGVYAGGITGTTARISNMQISNNLVKGLQINAGGQILSYGNNRITSPTDAPAPAMEQ
jgi:hypothetical protein